MARTRAARFANLFYPGDKSECACAVDGLLERPPIPHAIGGLLPHAGWVYSGPTAAQTIAAIRADQPETVIVFGAVHVLDRNHASLYPAGKWDTPLGTVDIDVELAERIAACPEIIADAGPHADEHSIEVELPLLKRALPAARIMPIMVRPGPRAADIGRFCAQAALTLGRRVAVLASTDLTHYGPRFGFEPHGRGEPGIRWAKDTNDRRFIDLVFGFDAGGIVPEAEISKNACGSGAVAAAIAAATELGAREYRELEHTCSAECEPGSWEHVTDSVGYHAGVFVLPDR